MELAELAALLGGRLDRELKPGRARHSRSVALLAGELCARHGLDEVAGQVAGLAHDLCKDLPMNRQAELAAVYSGLSGQAFAYDGVIGEAAMHGPAAAGLLYLEHSLRDGAILEAVALHTLGRAGMGELACIVYAADKLEPGRRHVDAAFRARCLALPPRELFQAVLGDTISWLRSAGRPVAKDSLDLYDPAALREIDA